VLSVFVSGLLSGNKRGPGALAGNLARSSPQQDDSSVTGRHIHTYIHTYIRTIIYNVVIKFVFHKFFFYNPVINAVINAKVDYSTYISGKRFVLYIYLVGKLKRRQKEGRGLYLSGAKDGSALINGIDMYASANTKRGGETGQGTPCHYINACMYVCMYVCKILSFCQVHLILSACRRWVLLSVVYKPFR
jgi:hypothetical protein